METSRRIFAKALGAEAAMDVRRTYDHRSLAESIGAVVAEELPAIGAGPQELLLHLVSESRERLSVYSERFLELAQDRTCDTDEPALRRKASLELAPFVIGTQYLLHAVAGNWNNEANYALTALRIHATDVGVGQPGASRIDRYQEVLRSYSMADVGTDLRHTAEDSRISEGAFTFPAALLILGCFPESLAGQILGANLYLRHCGLLPACRFVASDDAGTAWLLDLGCNPADGDTGLRRDALTATLRYAEEQGGEAGFNTVVAGFLWARHHVEVMHDRLATVLEAWLDPREAARQFVFRRSREATAYHEKVKLDRRPMRDLLSEKDTSEFLARLAASPFVNQGNPDRSPLLNGLISPRGKMFRIFSADDIAVLHRWIAGLPYESAAAEVPAFRMWTDSGGFAPRSEPVQSMVDSRATAREAYPRLLHVEISPEEADFARDYVDQWLERAARGVADGFCPLPTEWSYGSLRTWLHEQHEGSNQPVTSTDDIGTREEVIADVLALAPLTMIDGAWLTGFSHPTLASTPSGFALFETYFDELGNGIQEINHPVIYRDLLRTIHGELPATADDGYAQAACFDDGDFELPVFWLSIGRFPLTYQAEILGLNLAMELSGVGGGYLRVQRALKAHGFPTLFVELHNTIDNIATGHSAWAAASIDAFVSALPEGARTQAWERVRTGFLALNPPRKLSRVRKARDKVRSLLWSAH